MIKVLIRYEEKAFKSLEIIGHANSDEPGKDLVCAATSGIVIGGLNNLHQPNDFDITVKKGHVKILSKKAISSHDDIVIETIIQGLKTVADDNHEYVVIKNI
ncbi:MAG: ribosomal-processing cysteine protease Prp [Bacilli bacterium]|nr:ribosomal-processing cysteine protease Prp [Bacilli bacterium]